MKTNLFLITKYWRYHKKQFASMLTSIVILTAFLLIALLMERTECRRQYDDKLRGSSKTFYLYSNLGSDAYEEMSEDKRVSMIGRTAICGKLGNDKTQYTYGTYIDDAAEDLEYVKLSSGRFPEKTGEAAVYDYVLEDMFFTVDPDSYVGKEVTFDSYDLDDTYLLRTGRHVGQITFTITGVLCTDSRRDLKENRVDWESDLSEVQMPTIYLWRDDCDLDENTFVYTAVSLYGDDEITEQSESAMEEFAQDYYDKTGIWPRSGRSRSAAEDICNITLGNEKLNSESYLSDSVQGILYFSVIAVILSAISLFGVMITVMSERQKSLDIVRDIGASRIKVAWIHILEWGILLVSGVICGGVVGITVYEVILEIQSRFLRLPKLRGYTVEWCVQQITENPFVISVVCATGTFTLGYLLFYIYLHIKSRRLIRRDRVRSFGRIKSVVSGIPFANIMQMLSVALILFAAVMCYAFCSMDGKGKGYFHNDDLDRDTYYTYGQLDMETSDVDICLYDQGSGITGGVLLTDTGLTEDGRKSIADMNEVKSIESFSTNDGFDIFYDRNDEDIPDGLWQAEVQFPEDTEEFYHADDRFYFNVPAIWLDDNGMRKLDKYVKEGSIGTHENGVACVEYEYDGMTAESPYKIGDVMHTMTVNGKGEYKETAEIVDAIIVIPETTKESDPILYAGLGRASQYGYAIVASQDTAVSIGMFKTCYDVTYISLSNRGDIDRVVSRFADILDSSMELRIRTIDECDKEYREAYISQYASTICLFFILLIMAAWGYWELVTMRYQNGRRNVAIMRALGMEKHSWNMTFIWHNIRNALVSCAVGAGMVYGMRWLLRYKYEQALNMFNWPETDLWNVDADVIKEVTRLQHVFLFDSEIFVVPVGRALVLIGTFLVVISTIITVLVIHKKKSEEIIDDLAEKE